ncbi:gp34.93 [Bacillus phage SPO1]|uniref:Gp34.93 n=1 Tax=Bacillus phage SP01 TaxID=2884427 RepID=B6V326_BPSP1|nr:gp34.93 [Bacillus phage SPO1]ACI91109.1 gp34.93 [Bacillus phage SPO1]
MFTKLRGLDFKVLSEVYVDTAFTNIFGDQNLESLPEVYWRIRPNKLQGPEFRVLT